MRVRTVKSLQEFFRESVSSAMDKQGLDADDHTAYYVVNLLTLFARSEAFYEGEGQPLRPLALMLADAVDASSPEERNFVLQRVGDISLFVAGFFGESLAEKQVDIDYYVTMGGSAYSSLSVSIRGSVRGQAYTAVFAELGAKFQDFVDVLTEVRDEARGNDVVDVLRLYEVWLKTGSRRAARMLRRLGIEPNQALDGTTRH
ncbi:MAG: hypothetical protein JXB36_05500 [Gammaproteobacteria bacterium]|nr:hypothetical protein [Gammaproteobacteria bacterium]